MPVRVEALDHIRDLFGVVLRYQHVLLDCKNVRTRPFRIVVIPGGSVKTLLGGDLGGVAGRHLTTSAIFLGLSCGTSTSF